MIEHEDGRVSGSIDRTRVAELLAHTDDDELKVYYRDLLGESEEGKVADQQAEAEPEVTSESEPQPDEQQPVEQQDDSELEQLRAEAEALGVKVDKRWGADRLRAEIAAARQE